MQVWNVLHAACWKCRTQKVAVCAPSHTLSGYIFTTKAHIDNRKKSLLSTNISPACPYNMVNFGLLAAEIVSLVWGIPANFNGFCVLASLLQRRRLTAFTCAGRLYIHFRRLLLCNGILPGAKFTLRPPSLVLSYWQRYCAAVEQWARAKLCGIEHRAPPIFGRATITLGIAHMCSCFCFCC